MKILLIYHYFHPEEVISARLFTQLAENLAADRHDVTVYTGNRLMRQKGKLPECEQLNGINIKRFPRPELSQSSNAGRVLNSFILQVKWLASLIFQRRKFDAVILGTDPQFSYLMIPWIKLFYHKTKIIYWAFDLYPEALSASGGRLMRIAAQLITPFTRYAYRKTDVIADLGLCMRKRLASYRSKAREITLTPWALSEPALPPLPDPEVRKQLFGEAKLTLLYSGTAGYAHDLKPFIKLARICRERNLSVAFCFAGYGNCYQEQCREITEADHNIRLAGFVSEAELPQRLGAADIHMISLRKGWEGIVVPSKFFGALAMGKPVLYCGSKDSDIGSWILKYDLGWVLDPDDINATADSLEQVLNEPDFSGRCRNRISACYRKEFSSQAVLSTWQTLLKDL